ncbi:MAG: tRNA (adenosine(37)-N6)-threonylcarbamoyltransferase complex transferase subunit TsaD [Candidatus Micrarchaeia archaeon]
MAVLGIESSAHTLGIGIVENGTILANEKIMYEITDKGLIPARVADFHASNVPLLLEKVFASANLTMDDISAIGYTKGPGLGAPLKVGMVTAKTLSEKYKKPIFPVNHGMGHIEIIKTRFNLSDPLVIYVSGGNSQILGIESFPFRHYHIYGETFDIGIGNMLDNFARAAKLVPPWGSTVAQIAKNGNYIQMPYNVKGMDFTFTGLLTNSIKLLATHSKEDVAYSLQETAFSMLCEASERALMLSRKESIIICGGVAQSRRLQDMVSRMASSHSVKAYFGEDSINSDNGAMIAIVAEKMYKSGMSFPIEKCNISQRYRINNIELKW